MTSISYINARRALRVGLFLTVLGVASISHAAVTRDIALFGLATQPFDGDLRGAKPCYLDEQPSVLVTTINAELKARREKAVTADHALFARLSSAVLCQEQARALGITRLPSVVFNHQYVVTGVTNVNQAEAIFESWQGGQKRG